MEFDHGLGFDKWYIELIDLAAKGEVDDLISFDPEDYRQAYEDGISPAGQLDFLIETAT